LQQSQKSAMPLGINQVSSLHVEECRTLRTETARPHPADKAGGRAPCGTIFLFSITVQATNNYISTPFVPFPGVLVVRKLELNSIRSLKSHGGVDRALFSFDIDVDLEPAFHWNIKQLFVYVVASYATDTNPKNQVVLWDRIMEATEEDKTIKEDKVFVKYALVDQGTELRGKDIQLQLMWDHMPITGLLYMGEQDMTTASTFQLPTEYS
jgi:signal peptidase complex subunit 3